LTIATVLMLVSANEPSLGTPHATARVWEPVAPVPGPDACFVEAFNPIHRVGGLPN